MHSFVDVMCDTGLSLLVNNNYINVGIQTFCSQKVKMFLTKITRFPKIHYKILLEILQASDLISDRRNRCWHQYKWLCFYTDTHLPYRSAAALDSAGILQEMCIRG